MTNEEEFGNGQLSNYVFDTLLEWIMEGKLKMGDRLNTKELADQMGMSRMPVREALKSMEKKGLVQYVPYCGARIVRLTRKDVEEIYLARQALEPVAAREACGKISAEQLEKLEEIQKDYKKLLLQPEMDAMEVYQLNRAYHFAIYKASGLERICDMIESLWDTLSFFKMIYGQKILDSKEAKIKMIGEHESYLMALEQGEGELLARLLEENLGKRAQNIPYYSDAYFDREMNDEEE
jgi:DNA-binding GntR family transcriptional regulator